MTVWADPESSGGAGQGGKVTTAVPVVPPEKALVHESKSVANVPCDSGGHAASWYCQVNEIRS